MRIAVAGGTGVVGRRVVDAVTAAGHEPMVLARSRGVDLTTGQGLDDALAGVEAVIEVSNVTTARRRRSVAFFTTATSQLLAAGRRAGVRRAGSLARPSSGDLELPDSDMPTGRSEASRSSSTSGYDRTTGSWR